MSRQRFRRPPFRRFVECCLIAALVWLPLRTWLLQGAVIPCRVLSASMAAGLRGLHRDVTCGDCGFTFACDAERAAVGPRVVCPNCGFVENNLADGPNISGDGLLIARGALALRGPKRWEIVVFRNPNDARQWAVKRVVGLPGERVRIRDGEIHIDDQLQRKPLAAQRSTAVLVYDADFQPADDRLPPRWQGEANDTQWVGAQGQFAHGQTPDSDPIDWLSYRHWKRQTEPGAAREEPVRDDCGYNQSLARRVEDSFIVPDIMLTFRIAEVFGRGELAVRATDGREQFEVRLHPSETRYRVTHNGRAVPGAQGRLPQPLKDAVVLVSLFDRQFVLAFNDEPLVVWPYDPSDGRLNATARPVAIGAQGLGVVVRQLRVYRDTYYTRPPGSDGQRGFDRPWRLGDRECFLLGDNSPVSRDSRNWEASPAVPLKLLVGKPLAVLYPMQCLRLLGRDFQVPEPGKIRYIP